MIVHPSPAFSMARSSPSRRPTATTRRSPRRLERGATVNMSSTRKPDLLRSRRSSRRLTQERRWCNPGGGTFKQRLTLLHRDFAAPTVVYNSGYFVSTRGSRSQLTQIVNGNQLSMEYRYFSPSRPEPAIDQPRPPQRVSTSVPKFEDDATTSTPASSPPPG